MIGIIIGEEIISMICFAEYIGIITKIEGNIPTTCHIGEVWETIIILKMKINENKTKILVFTKKPQNKVDELYLNNHKFDQY